MPGWNECGIYDEKCRNKTCDHPTNKSRKTVPMDELLTIKNMDGIPFNVVYGIRRYNTGKLAAFPTVSFYDRRYEMEAGFGKYGQFVSDYNRETLMERQQGYALDLQGGIPNWTIDATTMYVVMAWLNHMVWQKES